MGPEGEDPEGSLGSRFIRPNDYCIAGNRPGVGRDASLSRLGPGGSLNSFCPESKAQKGLLQEISCNHLAQREMLKGSRGGRRKETVPRPAPALR